MSDKRAETKWRADYIAKLVLEENTVFRGNLFLIVSEKLRQNAQGYTAKLFENIAMEYGINPAITNNPKQEGK